MMSFSMGLLSLEPVGCAPLSAGIFVTFDVLEAMKCFDLSLDVLPYTLCCIFPILESGIFRVLGV
jgi:hypothetical protein